MSSSRLTRRVGADFLSFGNGLRFVFSTMVVRFTSAANSRTAAFDSMTVRISIPCTCQFKLTISIQIGPRIHKRHVFYCSIGFKSFLDLQAIEFNKRNLLLRCPQRKPTDQNRITLIHQLQRLNKIQIDHAKIIITPARRDNPSSPNCTVVMIINPFDTISLLKQYHTKRTYSVAGLHDCL